MKRWGIIAVLSCFATAAGCSDGATLDGSGGSGGLGSNPLSVLRTEPIDLATEVSPGVDVTVVFSEPVDASTVTPESFFVRTRLGAVAEGTLTVHEDTATFAATEALTPPGAYEATVTTAVQSETGIPLDAEVSWSFRTRDRRWGTAALIETNDAGHAGFPKVALDASGNGLVVWHQSDGTRRNIWANRLIDGVWGTPELIETNDAGHAESPQIALDARGNGLAVWRQSDGTRYSVWANRFVNGDWGIPELIETNDARDAEFPQVALDAQGNGLAVWHHTDGTDIWANRFVDGVWGTPELFETNEAGDAEFPQVALDAQGNGVAVWQQSDGTRDSVWANRFVDGNWSIATPLDTDDLESNLEPQVALDPSGNGLALWKRSGPPSSSLYASRFLDGVWGTPELIETDDGNGKNADQHQVAVDPKGNGVAVWRQAGLIWANRWVDGAWGTPEPIETDPSNDLNPQIALDGSGNGLAVWGSKASVWANRFIEGDWGTPERIETSENGAFLPQVALDPKGAGVAVWHRGDMPDSNYNRLDIASNRFE